MKSVSRTHKGAKDALVGGETERIFAGICASEMPHLTPFLDCKFQLFSFPDPLATRPCLSTHHFPAGNKGSILPDFHAAIINNIEEKEEKLPCQDSDSFWGFRLLQRHVGRAGTLFQTPLPLRSTSLSSLPFLEQLILFKVHLSLWRSPSLCL